ncbi:type II secretion system pilot lipoprotein GspS-beta [Photobacterium atrarenae]|uniref:Type II secretion system pilot lipoprotein GspS-beta n=1 Tax=Photobacterium atrarenae TaxID=865757 RepID=A0ABY5GHE8_9GAMM|nr:type II secretion system pilot lipoprotein GspS-beta [Photobacterium atrarenae]UTV28637.1 type II secretion system pilot lipoprotein GspS-beta [Photobacterium atrarenae]
MLKKVFASLAIFLLAGCASNPDDVAKALAKSRATAINNKAPYNKIGEYQVMKAQAREKTVEITILYGGGGKVAPSVAAKNAAVNYCRNEELTPLFDEGLNYRILIMDMRGRTMVEQPVYAEYCQSLAK